ncbi:MAG: T9SS type A sorting domain-containing protein [Bacteroidales bacterium]|nr:T9SS type A sorting domain-containing protein [Bacteroidales bacterium]
MMKKLLLLIMMIPVIQLAMAQDTIVKWTFPNNLLSDTVQNGTNALNSSRTIRVEGTSAIAMKNGATNYAAQATGWDNGSDTKNWNIRFKTTGYDHVQLSSKQQSGESYPGPKDFKLQYKINSTGTWADVPDGTLTLTNDWIGVSNLDLPAECQNQSDSVYIRWIMTSNLDIKGGTVAATGTSKIDDIIVTGILLTGLADQKEDKGLITFPNPSTSSFSISLAEKTSLIEIYNSNGQVVYKAIPENKTLTVEKPFTAGMYFIKATQDGKVKLIKHIVR